MILIIFQCDDKRVSRRHCEISVIDTQLKIKSVHTNPVFFTRHQKEEKQILKQNNEVLLNNLDKFSLLPQEYEYVVKIVAESEAEDAGTTSEAAPSDVMFRIRNTEEINDRLEAGNIATSLSQIMANDDTNEAVPMEQEEAPTSPQTSRKRSLDQADEHVESKKLKPSSSDEIPSTSTNNNPPNTETAIVSTTNDQATLPTVTIKPDPDAVTSTTVTVPVGIVKPDPDAAVPPIAPVPVKSIKPDPDGGTSTNANSSAAIPVTPDNQNQSPALRPSCEFGVRCYRNTPQHHQEFAHPRDVDYRRPNYPPAAENIPPCPWGASCYRRNPDHFRVLSHPSHGNFKKIELVRPLI
jgi:aprataxin and PNK-like factor